MFADHDLDGDSDLLVNVGPTNKYPLSGKSPQPPLLLTRHQGRFTCRSFSCGTFLGETHPSRSVAALDWDNHGDVDFAVSRVNEPSALLAHRLPANHYWLSVELSGVNGTRDAINASVHVVSSGNTRQLVPGTHAGWCHRRLMPAGWCQARTLPDRCQPRSNGCQPQRRLVQRRLVPGTNMPQVARCRRLVPSTNTP